jgi:hypothetical protein
MQNGIRKLQIFLQVFRQKRQHHRSSAVDKRNSGQNPDFPGKAFKIVHVTFGCGFNQGGRFWVKGEGFSWQQALTPMPFTPLP